MISNLSFITLCFEISVISNLLFVTLRLQMNMISNLQGEQKLRRDVQGEQTRGANVQGEQTRGFTRGAKITARKQNFWSTLVKNLLNETQRICVWNIRVDYLQKMIIRKSPLKGIMILFFWK